MSSQNASSGRRIGVLTYDFSPPIGGLGVLATTYVESLRRLFPEDTFIVISPSKGSDVKVPLWGRMRFNKSLGCPLFSLCMHFVIRGIVLREKLDLIHVHAGSGGAFLLRNPGCPVVATAHHTYMQEVRYVFGSTILKRISKSFMARLERATYCVACAVTCVSKDTADEIIKNYFIPASKVSVIENPVPTHELLKFRGLSRLDDVILFVGRLERRKGIMTLLRTFAELSTEFPTLKLRLVGANFMGRVIDRFIGSKNIADRVTQLGYVHNPYRFREMAQATVIVVPSMLEGFGLVAAEGMLLGSCVVASDAPGLKSVVTDGKVGLTFKAGDVEDFKRVVRLALKDAALRKRLGEQAIIEGEKRFDVDARAGDLHKVFHAVLR